MIERRPERVTATHDHALREIEVMVKARRRTTSSRLFHVQCSFRMTESLQGKSEAMGRVVSR